MMTQEMAGILAVYQGQGWVPEPESKRLLAMAGLPVPRYLWTRDVQGAVRFAAEIGYPVVAKVVSPEVVHKSDRGGVVTGIAGPEKLVSVFEAFSRISGFAGVLVEETLTGLELIAGVKMDYQFGPVILLGMGGTQAEIYQDVALRMAPLDEAGIVNMIKGLRAHRLLEGYRGEEPVNLKELSRLMVLFSRLAMEMEDAIESMDLNPLMCSSKTCVIADARIMLK